MDEVFLVICPSKPWMDWLADSSKYPPWVSFPLVSSQPYNSSNLQFVRSKLKNLIISTTNSMMLMAVVMMLSCLVRDQILLV